ncbi:MAG: hypothetical protein JXX28_16655 [Deltaproteobacteria bacterium]|nr:hypothetical protein [Deltaproteobacteria bacterium]
MPLLLLLTACLVAPTERRPGASEDSGLPDDTGLPEDTGLDEGDEGCLTLPPMASPAPPTSECAHMDWALSPDGWYLVSQFGTSWDSTTWGHETTCYWLQSTYDYYDCLYDSGAGQCLEDDPLIPWVQGSVDYDYDEAVADAEGSIPGGSDWPEIYYVAGAQRFGCGATLRVTNPSNGRCLVVYAEDGGPGATYEGPSYGGRRILDASPAVITWLDVQEHGWANSELLYVEFGRPGDVPGAACPTCRGLEARQGNEDGRSPWDPDHLTGIDCR